jgi:activator of HSP90 ATPase
MTVETNPAAIRKFAGCSRRKIIAQFMAGVLGMRAARADEYAKAIVAAKAIHQEEDFGANPKRIYEALLNAVQFKAFSGGRAAEIDRAVGGAFSLFDGHIVGRNLDLAANRRIVQAWRAASWPEGIFSIAKFELQARGPGAGVILDHSGFPPELAEHLASGWQENYWLPLRKYLG